MDFMPIIPINETEHDNLADTEILKKSLFSAAQHRIVSGLFCQSPLGGQKY
jgi:hypothetical protein